MVAVDSRLRQIYNLSAMPRTPNLFYNLVTDENSTTELLCNLMRFDKFRVGFLELFLQGDMASGIRWEDFETQVAIPGHGIPDIQIQTDDLLALIEVKVRPGLGPSSYQTDGYFQFVSSRNFRERHLVYLVPAAWAYHESLKRLLDAREKDSPQTAIRAKIILWEDVVALIERLEASDPNLFLNEFNDLLLARIAPKPVSFSHGEVSMLYSSEIPKSLSKLQRLVNDVQGQATMFKVRPSGSRSLSPSEYGVYFLDPKNRPRLWFGIWTDFWTDHGKPICFGVAQGWGDPVKQAFLSAYSGPTKPFKKYILGWVDEETLTSENAAKQVWEQLSPAAEATIAAELP